MKARITKLITTLTKLPHAITGMPAFFTASSVWGMPGGTWARATK